jgi:hypothetical protein
MKAKKQLKLKKYYVAVGDFANAGRRKTWMVEAKTIRGAIRAAIDKALYYEALARRSDAIVSYSDVQRV